MADPNRTLGVDNTGFVTIFANEYSPELRAREEANADGTPAVTAGYFVKRPPGASGQTHRPAGEQLTFKPFGGRRYFMAGEAIAAVKLDAAASVLLSVEEGH